MSIQIINEGVSAIHVVQCPNRIQVINDPNRGNAPYIRGIGAALEGLISHKTNELARKKQRDETASGLQHLLKISAQEAQYLTLLDPGILEHVVKVKLEQQYKQGNGLKGYKAVRLQDSAEKKSISKNNYLEPVLIGVICVILGLYVVAFLKFKNRNKK